MSFLQQVYSVKIRKSCVVKMFVHQVEKILYFFIIDDYSRRGEKKKKVPIKYNNIF